MPIDTHAAFRELENGGFNTEQAEALVRVINGATGEQATKADIEKLRSEFKADMQALRNDFKADMQALRNDFKADMQELRNDFKDQFATKADVKAEIAIATNKMLLGAFGIAGLLFAALKLFP